MGERGFGFIAPGEEDDVFFYVKKNRRKIEPSPFRYLLNAMRFLESEERVALLLLPLSLVSVVPIL